MFNVHRIAVFMNALSRFDFAASGGKPTEPNLLCRNYSNMTRQSLVLYHFKQCRCDLTLLKRIATDVNQGWWG